MIARFWTILIMMLLLSSPVIAAEDGTVLEKYENGKNKLRYELKEGKKHGSYTEWHENSRVKIRAVYKQGLLHGDYREFDERGRVTLQVTYAQGKKNGWLKRFEGRKLIEEALYVQDSLALPRSIQQIESAFAEIDRVKIKVRGEHKKASNYTSMKDRESGMRQIMKYRYLCGLPYEDLELDQAYNTYADYSVRWHKRQKKYGLSHYPKNNGMKKEDFDLAYKGSKGGNLSFDTSGMSSAYAVDRWMFDSRKNNLNVLGHRRWILNPSLLYVGISSKHPYACMYTVDKSRKKIRDYDFIAFPAPGYNPNQVFTNVYAWHVTLNSSKYAMPDQKKVKVKVTPMKLGKSGVSPKGKALKLEHFNVDDKQIGRDPHAIIFRPDRKQFDHKDTQTIYKVEITGLSPKKSKKKENKSQPVAATLTYYVAFYESRAIQLNGNSMYLGTARPRSR